MADRSASESVPRQVSSEGDEDEAREEMEKREPASVALLPRIDERRQASLGRSESESAAGDGGVGSYGSVMKRCVVPFFLLLLVVGFVSYTAGQKQKRGPEDWGPGRPLRKLSRPSVILISADGFRWTYNFKLPTPNIERLRTNGTEAVTGLIPVFPSLTFPNHYSIVTGLYPAWHGVIANSFSDPEFEDPIGFYQGNIDPKWWGGEPIWVTATKNGLQAATYFWPGSEVPNGPWTCPPDFCQHYNKTVPYEDRVDTVLSYMDLPTDKIPSFISLYFESPDHEGHQTGPDSPEVAAAVGRIDSLIGRLIDGLEARGLMEDVTIILVGDHGMAANCDSKMIYLEDMELGHELNFEWVDAYGALLSIRPPPDVDAKALYEKMAKAMASGKVPNSEFLNLYLKEDLPERLHYSANERIQPIIGMPAEGYKVGLTRYSVCGAECGGQHGYDNQLLSMRTVFIAHGPQFARGRTVPSFINVEIYNILSSILELKSPAANNGSSRFASSVLLPSTD
ncbi:hypothetical protein MPTK1_2g22060 [Marchantia polymorpha subsp. ruderalis]|uniref:Uncharacterized protein n=1 Tax=Marchantia polymorpha TaxID=3197 RepID=A0A2R6X2I7_MARPO|nr:hypothetical protein MARPO_0040s0009 [Marchantia polymorpha]BBN03254.1 hypothetical protein Mp_2g22060 [Marchantia polymorpha subsp. ruderalis]|eukprot:PTQ40323.1 hypothetical protein MARPO_0040s0009 [Marchantia polymorpha]